MIRRNFWQSLKNSVHRVQSHLKLKASFMLDLRSSERSFMYFTHSFCLLMNGRLQEKLQRMIVRKIVEQFREERIIAQKFARNYHALQIIVRNFTRTGTIGIAKMWGNFLEISFHAKFLRKAKKSRNFVKIRLHYFCTILH